MKTPLKLLSTWRLIVFLRLIFMILCFSNPLRAGGLKHMFDQLNIDHNVTGPTSFQDQAAGHYTGGGIYMRSKNKTVQLGQYSAPDYNLSCGKIDMYMGSLSFIKNKEFRDLYKSIPAGSSFYALDLAMGLVSPMVKNAMTKLMDYLNKMNQTMLNSCQASQQLVGAFWPKQQEASKKICEDMRRSGNSDAYAARKHCANDDKLNSTLEEAERKHSDLMLGNYNLVWHALKNLNEYQNNRELAEFVMTLVGTIISVKEGKFYRIKRINGKADSLKFIEVYLKGGHIDHLSCKKDLNKCVIITHDTQSIQGLTHQVAQMIQTIKTKYELNEEFTPQERSFLTDSSNLPVYKYIQVSAASKTDFLTKDAEEYIALSLMLKQFDRILGEIIDALDYLSRVQMHDEHFVEFRDDVKKARQNIAQTFTAVHTGAKWKLDKLIRAEERAIIARSI